MTETDEDPQIVRYLDRCDWVRNVWFNPYTEEIDFIADDIPVETFDEIKSRRWSFTHRDPSKYGMEQFRLERENDG